MGLPSIRFTTSFRAASFGTLSRRSLHSLVHSNNTYHR